ncbi:MAG: antitoxin Xre-like helix-turn-helix domain-containing protein [Anaerolineales bacterium]
MTSTSKNDPNEFDYLRLFGLKGITSINELLLADSKGLKSSHVSTFCRITGLSMDDIATIMGISRKQADNKMRTGVFSAKEADILLSVARIICEFFRVYPDNQDFWMLFLPDSEETNDMQSLYLSKTENGKGKALLQIHIEREDYLRVFSTDISTHKKVNSSKG